MKIGIYFFLALITTFSFSQAPAIEWQNTIGGDANDFSYGGIKQTMDGGYILGGPSNSGISGDKTMSCFGNSDYWILKLDSIGNILWQNRYGGGGIDDLWIINETNDGGYILGGSSSSDISGNKTESSIAGSTDFWIVKVNSIGSIEWQNDIGGAGNDILHDIEQTDDGGYILGGYSNSPISGDKTEASILGSDDYWVVKMDSIGNIEWQNVIGGDGPDQLWSIKQTTDGGYILGGNSSSAISVDKTEGSVGEDYWIVKINESGIIQWQNTIGGNGTDFLRSKIEQTNDSGYILGGFSTSGLSGDKSEPTNGSYDYWIVKLDTVGEIEWQNTIGGNLTDGTGSIHQTSDKGYILGGYSFSSISGDKTDDNIGFADYWILKLDSIGNILWQKTIGGWSDDYLTNIQVTSDGGYIIGGDSFSPISGDKLENTAGVNDFWIIKLACESMIFYHDADSDGYGNPDDFISSCTAPLGYIPDNTDCNDSDPFVSPGVTEVCNLMDDNCNFLIDEGIPTYTFYIDADGDSFGNSLIDSVSCLTSLTGYVPDSTDCDDSNPFIYPGSPEILDGIDNNCNGLVDEGFNSIEVFNHMSISIYPNPADNYLTIETPSNEMVQVIILNNVGETMLTGLGNRLNVSYLPAGIYFVKVVGENFTSINKVIKK